MALQFYEKMGKMTISQTRKDGELQFDIDIWSGNCLAVFTYDYQDKDTGEDMIGLYSFYADERHLKNIIKEFNGKVFSDKIISVELNMYYKQNYTLLKYFVKHTPELKVMCYYKEPEKRKN